MSDHSSDDLMVFEQEAAPEDYDAFLAWFAEQMRCDEDHAYNDSRETSESLRAWYREMLLTFPSGADEFGENGPGEYDEDYYAGYSIGRQMIYVLFVPLTEKTAIRAVSELAAKHGLGLFEPTSEGQPLWRFEAGRLVETIHEQAQAQQAPSFWERFTGKSKGDRLPRPRLPSWMS